MGCNLQCRFLSTHDFLSLTPQSLSGIVHTLVGAKKWKPNREELNKELRKLGLPKDDFKQSKLDDELLLDPKDPIENVQIIILKAD